MTCDPSRTMGAVDHPAELRRILRSLQGRIIAGAVLVLLAFGHAAGAASTEGVDGSIDKALKGAGLTRQLETLGQAMLLALPEDAIPERRTRNEAASLMNRSASKEALLAAVRSSVKEDLDGDSLDKVVQFYDSRPGKKAGNGMAEGLEPAAIRRAREGRKFAVSLSEARIETLQRIISAQGVVAANAALLKVTIHGLVDGSGSDNTDASRAEGQKARVKAIEKAILADKQRTQETALISYAHALRSLDDEDLQALAVFQESEPAQRFQRAVQRGLERAVYTAARELGELISKQPAPTRGRTGGASEQ
ncbi:MAG: hypothetical protein HY914_06010 [Desulfomonile tiedjei]|nr:hypothetical protein [Desulfomonile tiedjei]